MFGIIAKFIAGPLVGKLVDLFKVWQSNKLSEAELRAELSQAILSTFSEVTKSQASVIEAEIRGEDWLQRNWRPCVAVAFSIIPIFYGLIMPIMVAWWGFAPVRVGDILLMEILKLVAICLGGYIGGRSLEKIVKTIVNR